MKRRANMRVNVMVRLVNDKEKMQMKMKKFGF